MSVSEDKLTPRQLEALVNVYCGDRYCEKRIYPKDGDSALDGPASERPAWGKVCRYGRASNMGGAINRMKDALERGGYFPLVEGRTGRTYYSNSALTAKALRELQAVYPGLPDIAAKLAEREAVEDEARKAEQQRTAQAKLQREQRAERRQLARRERMAAVLQDYQVAHSLTPDQLEAMWLRIVEEDLCV